MAFKVGQEIVCINSKTKGGIHPILKEGVIYTIKNIIISPCCGSQLLGLVEVRLFGNVLCSACGCEFTMKEICFMSSRFRPLNEFLAEQSDFDLWKIEQEIEKEALQPA